MGLERDLLMLNQKLKLSHGTVTVDTMATATHTDMDMDTDTGAKSFLQCYQGLIIPQLKYSPLPLATFQKLFKVWQINGNLFKFVFRLIHFYGIVFARFFW